MDTTRYIVALLSMLLAGGLTLAVGMATHVVGTRLFSIALGIALVAGFLLGQHVLARFVP